MEFALRAAVPVDADDGYGLPHPSQRGNMAYLEVIAAEIAEQRELEAKVQRDLGLFCEVPSRFFASFQPVRGDTFPLPHGQAVQKGVIWSEEEKGCRYFPDKQQQKKCVPRSCDVIQVNTRNAFCTEKHSAGHRHQADIVALESRKETIGMKKKVEADSLSVTRQYPPTWNCGVCQANCSSELDLKNHLTGRRHQENLEALKREDKEMDAKLYAKVVLQLAEKNQKFVPRWSCSTCKANCTSASDLENHFRGRIHQQNVERSSNMVMVRA